MTNTPRIKKTTSSGFTIIELLIATTILSVILLVVTLMAVNIGNLFYKDVNQASIQDNVRAITDELSQHLQLMGTNGSTTGLRQTLPTNPVTVGAKGSICIDTIRYTYIIGSQISAAPTTGQSMHVLWRDTYSGPGCPVAPNLNNSTSGTELIAANSRLTALCVGTYTVTGNSYSCMPPAPDATTFTVTVAGAYGDADLLSGTTGKTVQCNGGVGDRFCATANLSTTVDQRLVTTTAPTSTCPNNSFYTVAPTATDTSTPVTVNFTPLGGGGFTFLNQATIDWGDGTPSSTVGFTTSMPQQFGQHTYTDIGNYTITIPSAQFENYFTHAFENEGGSGCSTNITVTAPVAGGAGGGGACISSDPTSKCYIPPGSTYPYPPANTGCGYGYTDPSSC